MQQSRNKGNQTHIILSLLPTLFDSSDQVPLWQEFMNNVGLIEGDFLW